MTKNETGNVPRREGYKKRYIMLLTTFAIASLALASCIPANSKPAVADVPPAQIEIYIPHSESTPVPQPTPALQNPPEGQFATLQALETESYPEETQLSPGETYEAPEELKKPKIYALDYSDPEFFPDKKAVNIIFERNESGDYKSVKFVYEDGSELLINVHSAVRSALDNLYINTQTFKMLSKEGGERDYLEKFKVETENGELIVAYGLLINPEQTGKFAEKEKDSDPELNKKAAKQLKTFTQKIISYFHNLGIPVSDYEIMRFFNYGELVEGRAIQGTWGKLQIYLNALYLEQYPPIIDAIANMPEELRSHFVENCTQNGLGGCEVMVTLSSFQPQPDEEPFNVIFGFPEKD